MVSYISNLVKLHLSSVYVFTVFWVGNIDCSNFLSLARRSGLHLNTPTIVDAISRKQIRRNGCTSFHSRVVQRSIVQVVPLSLATAATMLLLLLSELLEHKVYGQYLVILFQSLISPKVLATYLLGSWSCLRAMFLLVDPTSVPLVSGIACFPFPYPSLQ